MAGFNIQEFKSVINSNGGLSKTNHFLVEFPVPRGLSGTMSSSNNILSFYCKSGVVPGLGILTSRISRYGYGPAENKPFGTVVNDALMAMYVDNDNKIREWFYKWMMLVVSFDSSRGFNSATSNGMSAYEYSYKDEYAVDISVSTFSPEGEEINRIVMIEAYPNYLEDTRMDWDMKNQVSILGVSLTYRDWYQDRTFTPRNGFNLIGPGFNVFQAINNFASFIN